MTAGPVAVRATARLQLHRGFTFDDATARVPYLSDLGVSHVYSSPILRARAGSTHGYNVVDPTQVSEELGGEGGLRRLVAALRAHGMGLVVDIVPNHMAVGGADNAWWLDLLAHGPRSAYAAFFDIDWKVPDAALRGKLLAPFLGRPYGEALAAGEIRLEFDAPSRRFHARYFDHVFPIAARDLAAPADGDATSVLQRHDARTPQGRAHLHRLLERQHYRLAWWQAARDEINWRRFFDLAEYAGLRVEEPAVFEAVHATTFRLHDEGLIDGVRVDHVDGLADPRGYCRRLRARLGPRAYIVVEKILAPGERMPLDWRIDGTTGYSFMNDVAALLHEPAGAQPLAALWSSLSGRTAEFAVEERAARRRIAEEALASELAAAALALHRVARASLATRDVTLGAIRRVLLEMLVRFPVYRLYADRRGLNAADRAVLQRVADEARPACRPAERYLVDILVRWLGLEAPAAAPAAERRLRLRAITRFQQLTSPLAAKAVEDTAFYRHGRLLSRNEVGADPTQFAIGVEDFHAEALRRREHFPRAMLTTATHDHKRGEDARARLAVLSERAADWAAAVAQWCELNAPLRRDAAGAGLAPAAADEYMLYQTLVGHWPPLLADDDAEGLEALAQRVAAWHLKAVREAKLRTSWTNPDPAYEDAVVAFVDALIGGEGHPRFLEQFVPLQRYLARLGRLVSLSQTLLKLACPGVPDIYRGNEDWTFELVDPDNRRPIDWEARARRLERLAASVDVDDATLPARAAEIAGSLEDDRAKLYLTWRALGARRDAPAALADGSYEPLRTSGPRGEHLVAFARRGEGAEALVVVPRLFAALCDIEHGELPLGEKVWSGTAVTAPDGSSGRVWRNALTGERVQAREGAGLPASELLASFPVALLLARTS